MSIPTGPASGAPGDTPYTAARNLQNIQQRIIALNTRYGHVLGKFNLALQRLGTHLATSRAPHNEVAWDATATRLSEPVHRLGAELEQLTDELKTLVDQLADAREGLGAAFASRVVPQGTTVQSNPSG